MRKITTHSILIHLLPGVFLLAVGLVGVIRLTHRPTVPFSWKNVGNRVVVTGVRETAGRRAFSVGDTLVTIEGIAIGNGQAIEFLVEQKSIGDQISIQFQRGIQLKKAVVPLIHHDPLSFILVILMVGLMLWALAMFVLMEKSEETNARLFYWGAIILAFALFLSSPGPVRGFMKFGFILPVSYLLSYPLLPAILVHFAMIYPGKRSFPGNFPWMPVFPYILTLPLLLLLVITYMKAGMQNSVELYLHYFTVYSVFRAFLILMFITALGLLIRSYRLAASREEQNRVRWILWGIGMGGVPFIFLWTLPHVFGMRPFLPENITYIVLVIIPISFTISIVKYQAFDIEVVISKSLVYTILTAVIVAIYLLLVGIFGALVQNISEPGGSFIAIICTLIAAVLFSPLKQKIQLLVDRTFYHVKYNYKNLTREFAGKLAELSSPDGLLDMLLNTIQEALAVEKSAILMKEEGFGHFRLIQGRDIHEDEQKILFFPDRCKLVRTLEQHRLPLARPNVTALAETVEIPQDQSVLAAGMVLLLPVFSGKDLQGILCLGNKRSGLKYSQDDIDLLTLLSEETYMAFERLHFFERMILERTERERLEELNRLKSEFISHVSHELRTPMTAIRWSVENLLEGIPEPLSPSVAEYLIGVRESSLHLSRLIDNLLDISKIEAGKFPLFPTSLDIKEVVQLTLNSLTPVAKKKGLQIRDEIPEGLQTIADRDSLVQIFRNLIDNAIKYSNQGGMIRIGARVRPNTHFEASGSQRMVIISVSDQGKGIPPEKQTLIFDRFTRISDDRSPEVKGLGLGLHIAKKLVELNGGTIWVESRVGVGSTFSFSLPSPE